MTNRRRLPIRLALALLGILFLGSTWAHAQDDVVLVMTRGTGMSNQILIVHNAIPWNDIKLQLRDEYMPNVLAGGEGGWIVGLTQGYAAKGLVAVDGALSALALRSKMEAVLASGKIITSIGYGTGNWIYSTAEPLFPTRQQVLSSDEYPDKQIDSLHRLGWNLTSFERDADNWILIVSKSEGMGDQKIIRSEEFPKEEVQARMKDGYRITGFVHGEDEWVVVLSNETGWGSQKLFVGDSFPSEDVNDAWSRGYHITEFSWRPESILPSTFFDNRTIEARLERVPDSASMPWYREFIQVNKDTEYGFVAVQRLAGYHVVRRQWDQAIAMYRRYKSDFPSMSEKIDKIISILDRTDTAEIYNLGTNINTRAGEFMPLPSADDEALYFTGMNRRGGTGGEDIFVSRREGDSWGFAEAIGGFVNTSKHEFGTAVSADKNQLVLFASRLDGMGRGDLYYSERGPAGFGPLKPYREPINSDYWDCDGYLSTDGRYMFFSSDRAGGIGRYQVKDVQYRGEKWGNVDIWVSERQPDGSWGEPINLGETINTPWAERSPFLHPDGKTLYFCSSGHAGLGKLDVFVSKRLSEDSWTEWSEPVNLGKAINGVGSDWGYRVNTSGTLAYFAAENLPGSKGGSDIYAHVLPEEMRPQQVTTIRGVVTDTEGNKLQATIKWEDLSTNKQVGELTSDPQTGKYFVTLPLGKNYGYYAEREGYYPVTKSVDLREAEEGVDIEVNIELTPIEKIAEEGTSVRLNNIFFDVDKATLKPESRAELDRFAEMLASFPEGRIEIAGHTDSTASASYNKSLSQRRAQSVVNYLVERGIPRSNLVARGYGEEKPVADNGTVEGRSLNRRVEFRFLREGESVDGS